MKKGFFTIMAAQFFSSLADNALFVTAVELLRTSGSAEWQRAALVPMFALFYVVLAPFVGAFADAVPKGKVVTYILVVNNSLGSATGKFTVGQSITPPSGSMTITAQPLPASAPVGASATLSVALSGAPTSYTWYRVVKADALETVPAPSAPDLVLPFVSEASAGEYFVVATDRSGSSVSSQKATLTVLPAGD